MNMLHGRLSCIKRETADSSMFAASQQERMYYGGWVKMAPCNPYLLLFCLPATDTVKPAVFLHNATNSPEKLTLL
jgi:hypothetical protein